LLLPASARGHEVQLPIEGFEILVDTTGVAADRTFQFSTMTQPQLDGSHDPTVEPTWLLVRGYGPNGGTSGRIDLDPTAWSATAEGYAYDDPSGSRGGIRILTLQQGSLIVLGGGPSWPWDPGGPQQSVWFYFGIDEESFCASFGGAITQNQAGRFAASSAIAPAACPPAVCSNGVVELGEACDDGNLVEDDGCTSSCEVGSCVAEPFGSTLEAIQELVFEGRGCTSGVCHGFDPGQAGLDLRAGVSHAEMLDVPSTRSSFLRIDPGSPRDSSLYLKLRKAVDPTTDIPGAPMPQGLPPLPDDLLEAVRLYIENGAPELGTVSGTEALLGGCFPAPEPIEIAPLQPPDPEVGVQLAMPPWDVPAQSESEVCFATYYDFTDAVPESFKDPDGETFYIKRDDTRWDPHSHHLVILHSGLDDALVTHPSFGTWRCAGGESNGSVCDPLETSSCGEGTCRSRVDPGVACIGLGPRGGATAIGGLGGLLGPITPAAGLYTRVPLKGIVYWNSHTFNLTDLPLSMHAWRNFYFASSRRNEVSSDLDLSEIFIAEGQPPYTRGTYCDDHVLPQDTQLVSLSSHTHKRGEEFWIEDPDGNRIYDTFIYSDPLIQAYRPPLSFESTDPADRTLTYCATYNNGVAPDGSPDPSTVRSRSTTPSNGFPCEPVACSDGLVGAPCFGPFDHARCDSVPGAADGFCDACAITGGVTTEDEMFILITSSYVPEPGAGWMAGATLSTLIAIRAARRRRR
jgi:cysteine-rich repeat protein